jgi:superfamily II DNA or RNA helicase
MLANRYLEIRVGIPTEKNGILHSKIGIMKDGEDNLISFSGSNNETIGGWIGNIEEFKVFCNWKNEVERDYVSIDCTNFEVLWNSRDHPVGGVRVFDLPEAVRGCLIKKAPERIPQAATAADSRKKRPHELFEHQKEAVSCWIKNEMNGIFAMATGTGKTIAALGCIKYVFSSFENSLIVIACPFHHLLEQWSEEIENFNIEDTAILTVDGSNTSWSGDLADTINDLAIESYSRAIVLTTYRTLCNPKFISILENASEKTTLMLLADEVHSVGAGESRRGMREFYTIRLGLSATPQRYFDDEGSRIILEYFHGIVYEFDIEKALRTLNPVTNQTYLTPFSYNPHFISLNDQELDDYSSITLKIVKMINGGSQSKEERGILELLLFKRANIVKNASAKLDDFQRHVHLNREHIRDAIVYVSPEQLENTMSILNHERIRAHMFTMNEGIRAEQKYGGISERQEILRRFKKRDYDALVAMKCLDEGVDIPTARIAFLLANSGNPREYVQRIGRVIRRSAEKEYSEIHDWIVIPALDKMPSESRDYEFKIFDKELKRYEYISRNAYNSAESNRELMEIRNKLLEMMR